MNYYFHERRKDFYGRGVPFLVDESVPTERDLLELDLSEILSISWVFFIIHSFYSLLFMNVANFLASSFNIGKMLNFQMMIYATLIQVIFFPLVFWTYAKVWILIVEFFGDLFIDEDKDISEIANQIIGVSLVSHIYLLIPVIGGVIRHFAFFIYLFAGLRQNLGLSVTKSLMVLLSPLFILGLLGSLFVLMVATVFVGF
ncbi:MAG: hypothetical protein DRQ88_12600 [Epsilonproteobacteria bacterium]|nr:MAG: hypothetical protein DRQ89_11380 [Campylobacterota bacterium]RLA63308.1 MAG: hypothetical protein DRQ88_12600 [Campylobacterota bacterium]